MNSAGVYEEDLFSSSPIRIAHWREMETYAASLPERESEEAPAAAPGTTEGRREAFRRKLGCPPPGFWDRPEAPRFETAGEDGVAAYHRCRIRVAPHLEAYGLYIVPRKRRGPVPLLIAMHGGGGYPELATFQGGSNYHDMVRGPVGEGWAVFAPLAVMHPFRDRDTPIPEDVRERLDARLKRSGSTLMGVEVAKIMRSLDALLSLSEIDPNRVAMAGLSYGGFYTLYAAALDPRIRAGVASCCFWHPDPPGNPPEGRPEETQALTSWELAELASPRPLQVQSGISDEIYPIEGARRAAEQARAHYRGDAASAIDFQAFDGGHEFNGSIAWPFLRKYLTANLSG